MNIIRTKKEMQLAAVRLKADGKSIGFVPTMGYLHQGHMALVSEAKQNNDVVIMSVFVNPLQFGPGEDFDAYPRNPDRDEQLARKAGADLLFYPSEQDIYDRNMSIKMQVIRGADVMCGENRPGHFDGVVTVLAKLFNIVLPDRAYFGLKDAQQVAVVTNFVRDLDFPVEIISVPTIREDDGLAVSSRNVYLSQEEREQAPYIYRSLQEGVQLVQQGEKDPSVIRHIIEEGILRHTDGQIDYIQILTYPALEEAKRIEGDMIIAAAVKFSHARLIDNVIISA